MINARAASVFARTTGLSPLLRKAFAQGRRSASAMTPRKAFNLALLRLERLARRSVLLSHPYNYVIDPVNYCVLRCPLCPTGRGTLARSRGQIAVSDYEKIVSEIAPYALSVDLYNWGEPLIHKEIFDLVRFAKEKGISTKMSTNLNVINETRVSELVSSGLDELAISLDGADQETYETYRAGGDLTRVLWGVRRLVAEKQKRESRHPWLTVRVLLHRGNEATIETVRQLAWSLDVDNVVVAPILVNVDNPADVEKWLPSNSRQSYYDYATRKDRTTERVRTCAYLWERMVISWDGGVSPCCWYDKPSQDFGNVLEGGVSRVWNGQSYVSARRVFGGGGEMNTTICSTCKGRPHYEY